jgi:hypothetical protein
MADIYNNPVIPPSPSIDDYYNQSMQRIQQVGLRTQEMFAPEEPEPTVRTAKVAIDTANNKLFIGGYVVDRNNDTDVAVFSKYAGQEAPLPEGNWEQVDDTSFAQYVQGIRDPGTLKLMARNFGMGVDEMQQMAGLGLQWLGAEQTGTWLADQEGDLQPNQVYSRSFTDIGSSPENGALDWIAATIGRLGPNVVESTISAGIGAAIGGAVSGPAAPAAAPIGAIAGFFGKTAVKKALLDAAKKRLKGEALNEAEKKLMLSAAGMTNAAANATKTRLMSPAQVGEFIDEGTRKGAEIVGGQVARRAAQVGGAAGLSTASNIFQQTGAAYGETMAGGGEGERGTALVVGTIGGLLDTAPEFLLAGRLFSELAGDVASVTKTQRRAMDVLKGAAKGRTGRIAGYGAGGAAVEGATEGVQEVLQIAANPILDLNSDEAVNRIVNAFAAGALMGGTLGGAGGAFAGSLADNKTEANLLLPVSQSDPNFAQYREDLKKTFSKDAEKQVSAIYPPRAPAVFSDVGPSRADLIAAQGVVPPSATQPQGELFANAPMGNVPAPVPTGPMLPEAPATGQGAFPFTPSARYPVPAVPANIPSPAEMVGPVVPSGTQASLPFAGAGQAPAPVPTGPMLPPSTDMGGTQLGLFQTYAPPAAATPQGELLLRGGAGRAPAPVPTGPMPQSSADMGGVQGALQPQKLPPPPPPPTNAMQPQLERLRRGMEFEQARRQAATRATPAERVYTEATIDQPITLDVEGASTGKNKLQDDGRRRIIAGFNALTKEQQDRILVTFDNDEQTMFDYVRREKPPVVRKQFATLARVDEDAFKVKTPKPAEPQPAAEPLKRGEKNAAQPGAGAESAGPDAAVSGDGGTGKKPPLKRGSSGKAGKGDGVRAGEQKPAAEPAPKEQGPAARSEALREEAGGAAKLEAKKPVVVEKKPPRRTLKKPTEPEPPKAEGAAVAPSQEAAKTKGKKPAVEKVKPYKDLTEEEQLALAKEAEKQGATIATLMEREQDVPDLPMNATKVEADLYEVYGTIGNIILAQRDNKKAGVSVKEAAKAAFIENVGTLYNWATKPGTAQEAKNAAAAYLDAQISASETVPLKEGVKQAIKDAEQGMFRLSQFDAVTNPVDENGRPAKGVNPIRARAIVDKFRSGLAKAPRFYVYKNQADLQRRNPELYQRAVGARPQGDFDTAPASGYAFDNTVLVFTDRIPTEKYMRFLLAHEAIGHYGMRSLLPAKQFDALMDYVYDNNPKLQLAIDGVLGDNKSLGARREAVEEYMAKFAETLDSSILRRVWSAIKDVLNKLGVKFEDDIVRYLVSQARSTVRNGSSMFTPSTFALNLQTVMTNNGTGRFSNAPIYTRQHSIMNSRVIMDAPPANLGEIKQALKDWGVNSRDTFEVVMRNIFRLRNYNALRNHGAQAFEYLKDGMRTAAQALRNTYNERLAKLLALTGDSRRVVSFALVISRRIANRRFELDKELRNESLLVLGDERPDGMRATEINKSVFDKLVALGTLSKEELEKGAEVTYEETDAYGKTKKVTAKIKGLEEELGRGLTDEEYAIYVQTRRDLAEIDIERLKAQYDNFFLSEKVSTKGISKVLADNTLSDDDVKFIKGAINHAKKLFVDEIEYDARGLPEATAKTAQRMEQFFKAVNTAVVKKEFTEDLKKELREFYLPKPKKKLTKEEEQARAEALTKGNDQSEAFIKKLEEFRGRRKEFTGREEQSVIYTLQDRVKEIVLADAAFERAQMYVRRSIASSHVPLWREGSFQVRVEAQINGERVTLHPEVQNKMIYSLSENKAGAEGDAKFFNDNMKDVKYSGLVYDKKTGEYKTQTFTLFARASKAVETVASDPSIDIDNFLYTMRVLGIPVNPEAHADAIVMLTAPGNALRKSLQFDDTPGYDATKTVEAIARHVTTRSSLIARTRFQPLMRDLMNLKTDSGMRWYGDAEAVMVAKERFDAATDQKQKDYWQDTLTTELYKYVTTNPGAKGWDGSRANNPSRPEQADLGMRDYEDAVKELEWLMDSANISESTFEGKRYAALAKMITSVGFLGGMMTQFAQNLMSPATNVLPYLASKDSQTGFGGGFGMAVMPMYLKSFKDVVAWRDMVSTDPIVDAKKFEDLAARLKAARDIGDTAAEAEIVQTSGLTYYEALNIAREIREGKLIPAQANALLETARGIFTEDTLTGRVSKKFLKFSDYYMLPFNVSEQATRRATFLTAFRLEFARLKEAGFAEDKASEMARLFAVDTVDKTLGEYSNTNRPPVWRDGWMSLLFVYKTYPLTSLLLFKNMSRAGKIGMLTSLYVLAGAAGFPLVDDIEDLIDTLSQRFGLDLGQGPAVRMALVRQLEEFFPGWSDLILRGPMNHYTGMDVGAKFGLEDFIPGTGIFLKGANTTQELKGIAGPVIGMGLSMANFAYDFGRAPFSSTVSALDVVRESPFSLARAIGDSVAYMQSGAIVDRRGYVVSPEVSALTVASRILGFYPADAARQYDFIKYANRMNYDYKEVGTAYRLAWVKAMMAGDRVQAARIVREVNDWNEANKGGPGVIRNFMRNAQKALQEARRPAGERFLKSAPVASRASLERFLDNVAPPE